MRAFRDRRCLSRTGRRSIEEGARHDRPHRIPATTTGATATPSPCGARQGALLGLTVACAGIGAWTIQRIWTQLPSVEHLAVYRPALPLRIFSRDGDLLAEYGVERREFVPLERIPPLMRQALLAAEDAKFYQHGAVDFSGLARATFANVVTGQPGQGGSTITMQVARNFYLTRDKVLSRKLAEILMATKLEREYSKDKLLELYMNEIYLGERRYGFAAAANVFRQAARCAERGRGGGARGLPKAPSAFNPVVNPARDRAAQPCSAACMRSASSTTRRITRPSTRRSCWQPRRRRGSWRRRASPSARAG